MNDQIQVSQNVKLNSVRGLLESMKKQFEMALPKHMTPERLMRVALTACQRNPRLLDCTPRSFAGALMTAAQVGLEPDGTLGRAYLIPRKNNKAGTLECHFQPGYQGLLELTQRSGQVASVRADVVRKGDFIEFEKGLSERLVHREGANNFEAPITHIYAIVRTQNGGSYWDCWPAEKVEAHRLRFSKDTRDDSVWQTDWASMAKKTVLTAVLKLAPKSVELAAAVVADERAEAGLPQDIELVDEAAEAPAAPPADEKPKTIEDIKRRVGRPRKAELLAAAAPPEAAQAPPAAKEPPVTAATVLGEGEKLEQPMDPAMTTSYCSAIASQAQRLGPGMFKVVVQRTGGDPLKQNYGLGGAGLRDLLNDCLKA